LTDWALRLLVVYLVFAFGVRVAVSLRTTGKTGITSIVGAPPVELLGGSLFVGGIAAGVASPILVKHGNLDPMGGLDVAGLHAVGFLLVGVGIAGTFLAQMQMGTSWRIGVDESERTDLITGGLFSLVRNPIYSFMIAAWTGFALMVPTWLALASVPIGLVGLEIQVRLVEEPHMLRTQGEPYRAWAARVGRFLPGIGRLAS
jgi:steroid 5-alpha reductase family enzyme